MDNLSTKMMRIEHDGDSRPIIVLAGSFRMFSVDELPGRQAFEEEEEFLAELCKRWNAGLDIPF